MAHVLNLTDGTDTIALNSLTSSMVLSYTPGTPELTAQEVTDALRNGGEFGVVTLRNVTETAELLLIAASKPAVQVTINAIEAMLQSAMRRQRSKSGPRVYIQLQVDGEAGTWRSEILSGRLELDESALRLWPNIKAAAMLHITRRYFWESTTLTELQLASQASSSPATGGKTIHNRKDATQGNYVQILDTQVAGAIPAPIKLQLKNNTGAAQDYRNIYIANNAFSDPANFAHIIEGENRRAGWGTAVTGQSSCSNGGYVTATFTGASSFKWDLSSTLLAKTAGQSFRLLGRFFVYSLSTPIYVRAKLQDETGLIDLQLGDEIKLPVGISPYELIDLGELSLPPGGYSTNWALQTLTLAMRASASVTVSLDYIQLTPLDSYRHLIQRGMQIANNDAVVDDGPEGMTYSLEAGAQHPIYSPRGEPVYVFPGVTQRLYVLHDEGFTSPIGNSFSVQAWYRPRRLTI